MNFYFVVIDTFPFVYYLRFSEDICDEYKFSDGIDEFDGLAADGREDGEED